MKMQAYLNQLTVSTDQMPRELPGLTGLRGLAAAVVVLAHFGIGQISVAFRVVLWQNAAVDLFFVLSCFTLLHVHDRETGPMNWPRFAIRRVARIYPLYGCTLLVIAIYVEHFYGWHIVRFAADLISQFLLVNCWPLIGDNVSWALPSWSLSVEWLCYFGMFPPLLLLHRRSGDRLHRRPLIGLSLALAFSASACLVCLYFFRWSDLAIHGGALPLQRQLAPALRGVLGFAGGFCLFTCDRGLRRSTRWLVNNRRGLILLADITLVTAALILILGSANLVPTDLMIVLSPALVLCAASPGNRVSSLVSGPLIMWLGELSYSLYLVHYPVLMFGMDLLGRMVGDPQAWFEAHPTPFVVILLTITLPLASMAHYFLERPLGRTISLYGKRIKQAA